MKEPEFSVELRLPGRISEELACAHGWLVHGTDRAVWIAFVSRLAEVAGLAASGVSLYPISDENGATAGLLIPLSEPLDERSTKSLRAERTASAEPLVRLFPDASLLMPVGAALEPPLDAREVELSFPLPVELLHPRVGRVGFELRDAIGLADLVRASSPPRPSPWTGAVPGAVLAARIGPVLAGVGSKELDSLRDAFGESIGRGDREPLPDEAFLPPEHAPRNKAKDRRSQRPNRWTKGVARRVLRWTSGVDATADRGTWVNRVEDWAQGVLARDERSRAGSAIQWLLKKLDEEPDEGLRYAIPIGGDRRGERGDASSGLARHGADFDLDDLGVKRGTSIFGASHHEVLRLEAAYREQANRAVESGDTRRAAFIHAHLLHDLRAAALVLERGGYYRESAALWQERLNEPLQAARCLAAGGFVDEAVLLYVKAGAYAEAAIALEEKGRGEDAVPHWESAVEAARGRGDLAGAATLIRERLAQPERASHLAFEGWKESRARVDCLGLWLELQAERDRLHEVSAWAASGTDSGLRARLAQDDPGKLFREVARFKANVKDAGLADDLDDELRVSAAGHLGGIGGIAASSSRVQAEVLDALRELQPNERVFGRDLSAMKRSIKSAAAPRIQAPKDGVRSIRQVRRV
ncbi:MAG: hypothetical protein AAGG01_13215, partial [Planctomycetota bacterium]